MTTKNYQCTNGTIAYLSANTKRVFNTYEEARKDAQKYLFVINDYDENKSSQLAVNDVYIVHMWFN